jgi:hypothetical protein
MIWLRKIGVLCGIIGLLGLIGPRFGFGIRGLTLDQNYTIGSILLGVGVLLWGVGFGFAKDGAKPPRKQ